MLRFILRMFFSRFHMVHLPAISNLVGVVLTGIAMSTPNTNLFPDIRSVILLFLVPNILLAINIYNIRLWKTNLVARHMIPLAAPAVEQDQYYHGETDAGEGDDGEKRGRWLLQKLKDLFGKKKGVQQDVSENENLILPGSVARRRGSVILAVSEEMDEETGVVVVEQQQHKQDVAKQTYAPSPKPVVSPGMMRRQAITDGAPAKRTSSLSHKPAQPWEVAVKTMSQQRRGSFSVTAEVDQKRRNRRRTSVVSTTPSSSALGTRRSSSSLAGVLAAHDRRGSDSMHKFAVGRRASLAVVDVADLRNRHLARPRTLTDQSTDSSNTPPELRRLQLMQRPTPPGSLTPVPEDSVVRRYSLDVHSSGTVSSGENVSPVVGRTRRKTTGILKPDFTPPARRRSMASSAQPLPQPNKQTVGTDIMQSGSRSDPELVGESVAAPAELRRSSVLRPSLTSYQPTSPLAIPPSGSALGMFDETTSPDQSRTALSSKSSTNISPQPREVPLEPPHQSTFGAGALIQAQVSSTMLSATSMGLSTEPLEHMAPEQQANMLGHAPSALVTAGVMKTSESASSALIADVAGTSAVQGIKGLEFKTEPSDPDRLSEDGGDSESSEDSMLMAKELDALEDYLSQLNQRSMGLSFSQFSSDDSTPKPLSHRLKKFWARLKQDPTVQILAMMSASIGLALLLFSQVLFGPRANPFNNIRGATPNELAIEMIVVLNALVSCLLSMAGVVVGCVVNMIRLRRCEFMWIEFEMLDTDVSREDLTSANSLEGCLRQAVLEWLGEYTSCMKRTSQLSSLMEKYILFLFLVAATMTLLFVIHFLFSSRATYYTEGMAVVGLVDAMVFAITYRAAQITFIVQGQAKNACLLNIRLRAQFGKVASLNDDMKLVLSYLTASKDGFNVNTFMVPADVHLKLAGIFGSIAAFFLARLIVSEEG